MTELDIPRALREQLPRASAVVVGMRHRRPGARSKTADEILSDLEPHELRNLVLLMSLFIDTRRLLEESIETPIQPVEQIIEGCARRFGITPELLVSEARNKTPVEARQVAAYIAHRLCGIPSTQVGRALNRDHATILSSCKRVDESVRLRKFALTIAQGLGWTAAGPQDLVS